MRILHGDKVCPVNQGSAFDVPFRPYADAIAFVAQNFGAISWGKRGVVAIIPQGGKEFVGAHPDLPSAVQIAESAMVHELRTALKL